MAYELGCLSDHGTSGWKARCPDPRGFRVSAQSLESSPCHPSLAGRCKISHPSRGREYSFFTLSLSRPHALSHGARGVIERRMSKRTSQHSSKSLMSSKRPEPECKRQNAVSNLLYILSLPFKGLTACGTAAPVHLCTAPCRCELPALDLQSCDLHVLPGYLGR